MAGDVAAAKVVLDRVVGKSRPEPASAPAVTPALPTNSTVVGLWAEVVPANRLVVASRQIGRYRMGWGRGYELKVHGEVIPAVLGRASTRTKSL